MWYGAEDADNDDRDDERSEKRLHEYRVLDLAQSRFLDPNFTIKHLSNNVAFVVLGNPRLVLIAVGRVAGETFLGEPFSTLTVDGVVLVGKQLPWSEMAMVHSMEDLRLSMNWTARFPGNQTYHTHALPGSDKCRNTNQITEDW